MRLLFELANGTTYRQQKWFAILLEIRLGVVGGWEKMTDDDIMSIFDEAGQKAGEEIEEITTINN